MGILQNELKQTQEALAQANASLQANGLSPFYPQAANIAPPATTPVYQPPPSTSTPGGVNPTPLSNSQGSTGQGQTPPNTFAGATDTRRYMSPPPPWDF